MRSARTEPREPGKLENCTPGLAGEGAFACREPYGALVTTIPSPART